MNDSTESSSIDETQKVKFVREIIEVSSNIGARVKYTSIDSCSIYFSVSQYQSNNVYVILGANTGSIYFYEYISKTNNLKLISLLSNKEIRDSISLLKSNSYGSLLAVSTTKNTLILLEHNLIQYHINRSSSMNESVKEKHNILAKLSVKDEITCMIWNEDNNSQGSKEGGGKGTILYIGDSTGSVFAINYFDSISNSSTKKNIMEHLYKCDSPIVQLDYRDNKLLISSYSRSTIIDFQKHSCYQIGSQLRDGLYGSCFCDKYLSDLSDVPSSSSSSDITIGVLAGRPGKRIWLADSSDGHVVQTLNFKESLALLSVPSKLVNDSKDKSADEYDEILRSSTFAKIESIKSPSKSETKFVISWDSHSNTIFLIDIVNVKIIDWYADLTDMTDASICYHWGIKREQEMNFPLVFSVFFLHSNLKSISMISLFPNIYSPISPTSSIAPSVDSISRSPSNNLLLETLDDNSKVNSTPIPIPTPNPLPRSSSSNISDINATEQTVSPSVNLTSSLTSNLTSNLSSSLSESASDQVYESETPPIPSSPREQRNLIESNSITDKKDQKVTEITEEINKSENQDIVATTAPTASITSSSTKSKSKRKKRTPVIPTLSTNSFPSSSAQLSISASNSASNSNIINNINSINSISNIALHSSIGSNSNSISTSNSNSSESDFKLPSRSASDDYSISSSSSSATSSSNTSNTPILTSYSSSQAETPTPPPLPSKSNSSVFKLKDSVSKDITNSLKGVLNKTKTKSLDEFKQLKNLIKEVTNTSISNSNNSPKVADVTSHTVLSNISNNEERSENSSSSSSLQDIQLNPFYQLSKTTYDALVNYRRESEKQSVSSLFSNFSSSSTSRSLLSLLALIDHWLTSFTVSQTMIGGVPTYWITEIVTNYLELKISKDAFSLSSYSASASVSSSTAIYHWSDQEASRFIDKYYEWMNLHRIFFACNQSMLIHSIRLLLEKEDSLFIEYSPLLQESLNQSPSSSVKNMLHFNVIKEDFNIKTTLEKYIKENDIAGAITYIKKINAGKAIKESIFLRFIPFLFSVDPIGSARLCAPFYPSILPWNVHSSLLLCLTSSSPSLNLSSDLYPRPSQDLRNKQEEDKDVILSTIHEFLKNPNSKSGEVKEINKWKEYANVYLQYLIMLMNNFTICRNDSKLVHSLFEYCLLDSFSHQSLISSLDDHLKFDKGAHLHKFKHEDVLLTIIGVPSPNNNPSIQQTDEVIEEKVKEKSKKGKKNQTLAQREEQINEISTVLKRGLHPFTTNSSELIAISRKYKFYQGLIILYTATGQRKNAIDLFIQSDDLVSFKKVMADNFRESEWIYLLSILDSIPDSSLNTNITLEVVIDHMINCLDISFSIQLLLSHSFFSKKLLQSSEILKQLVQKGKMEEEQRKIRNKVLETLNDYLWAKKSPTLPPQVRAVLEVELVDKDSKKNDPSIISSSISTSVSSSTLENLPFLSRSKSNPRGFTEGINTLDLAFDYAGVPRFVEDSNLHWGSSIGSDPTPIYSHSQSNTSSYVSGTCGYCTLPVDELIGDSSTSVVIFPCGHAFHQLCNLEMDACLICYQSNLVTLLAE